MKPFWCIQCYGLSCAVCQWIAFKELKTWCHDSQQNGSQRSRVLGFIYWSVVTVLFGSVQLCWVLFRQKDSAEWHSDQKLWSCKQACNLYTEYKLQSVSGANVATWWQKLATNFFMAAGLFNIQGRGVGGLVGYASACNGALSPTRWHYQSQV